MSEMLVQYRTPGVLKREANGVIVNTEVDTLRADLEEIERRLIPLLVTVQRALGKEPTVLMSEKRRRAMVERRR